MDNSIFEKLYSNYVNQVFLFLLKLCCNYDLAEDLTQETFLKAYQNIDDFRGDCKLYVWLCQIGKNLFYNHLKKESHLYSFKEISLSSIVSNMEEGILNKIVASDILRILSTIAEPYQTVFILRTLMQCSYTEIGINYSKTDVWARVTYYRAKNKLQEKLREEKAYEM